MPISGPSSYLPTLDDFLAHWAKVDTALGAGSALMLADGTSRQSLSDQRDLLETARDAITDGGIELSLARETLLDLHVRLQRRLVEFNERVRADLPGSVFARVLPLGGRVGDAEGLVREALRQMRTLWGKINAIPQAPPGMSLPLKLENEYPLAGFDTDCAALRDAYRALSAAEQNLNLARESRNDLQDFIYPMLKGYRQKVPTKFPAGNALVDSLPALTPAPGRTPDAVHAQAVWDAPSTQAKVTWPASKDADLEKYEVRGVPGDVYNTDDEAVLASVPKDGAREFLTDFALSAPGLTAGFKVYVVLSTGNEKGSDAVYVTRPAGP